ncbi:Ribonuclease HI-related protein [Clostridiaceae bacterium JG1575]|nr:Ribonuclease HI-related protein [Clostridiaceae bacterium JG1575]
MKKKIYAVINGREGTSLYESWEEAKAAVTGVSGVLYQGFATQSEALEYLARQGAALPLNAKEGPLPKTLEKAPPEKVATTPQRRTAPPEHAQLIAYVDGSFREGCPYYGYGVVILWEGSILQAFGGRGQKAEYLGMRNVAGEILGAISAMRYARSVKAQSLTLYFDYQGIESWATGRWKRNNALTKGYHEFVQEYRQYFDLFFVKVKGHSGDPLNEMADELAKKSLQAE